VDVNSPLDGESLNRVDPAKSYNSDYLKRIFSVVEAFKDFPNTLGFFGGNEVINEDAAKSVPAYLRVCLPPSFRPTVEDEANFIFLGRPSIATSRITSPNMLLVRFLSDTLLRMSGLS
jgi:hypothetical protein